jgi:hypothetical protein
MGKPGIWYWLWMITLLMGGLLALATLVLWTRLPGDVRNLAMALTWGLWALAIVCFFLGGIVAGFTIRGVNHGRKVWRADRPRVFWLCHITTTMLCVSCLGLLIVPMMIAWQGVAW